MSKFAAPVEIETKSDPTVDEGYDAYNSYDDPLEPHTTAAGKEVSIQVKKCSPQSFPMFSPDANF